MRIFHHRKFTLIWQSPESDSQAEVMSALRVRYFCRSIVIVRRDQWAQITIILSHPQKENGGFHSTTFELYVSGYLTYVTRITRRVGGIRTLFVGGSPSNKYHFYGRIYQLMVSDAIFSDQQISLIFRNKPEDIKSISHVCQGTYLLRSEAAPPNSAATESPVSISTLYSESSSSIRKNRRYTKSAETSQVVSEKKTVAPDVPIPQTPLKKKHRSRSSQSVDNPPSARSSPSRITEEIRGHAAPTESPAQSQATVAEADLQDTQKSRESAQLLQNAQTTLVFVH